MEGIFFEIVLVLNLSVLACREQAEASRQSESYRDDVT